MTKKVLFHSPRHQSLSYPDPSLSRRKCWAGGGTSNRLTVTHSRRQGRDSRNRYPYYYTLRFRTSCPLCPCLYLDISSTNLCSQGKEDEDRVPCVYKTFGTVRRLELRAFVNRRPSNRLFGVRPQVPSEINSNRTPPTTDPT